MQGKVFDVSVELVYAEVRGKRYQKVPNFMIIVPKYYQHIIPAANYLIVYFNGRWVVSICPAKITRRYSTTFDFSICTCACYRPSGRVCVYLCMNLSAIQRATPRRALRRVRSNVPFEIYSFAIMSRFETPFT
jgi:hypothetical protein